MITTILFDVDGVLVNGKRFSEILELELGVPKEQSLPFFTGKFQDCLVGKADLKKELQPLLKEWRVDKTVDEFIEYWFKSEHMIDEELVSEVKALQAQGFSCYVVTNQEAYRTQYIINEMGFGTIFKHIFSSADLGYMKPQDEFFLAVLNTLAVKPEQTLFVDDTKGHIESAKRLGLKTILYSDVESFRQGIKEILRYSQNDSAS